jgi:hypothetical protein
MFAKMWDEYASKVLPKNANWVQVRETRRAFYSGGLALFYGILSMLEEDAEPTPQDLQRMDALKAEFDAYARDIAEGRA